MWGSGDIFSREPCDIPYKYNEKNDYYSNGYAFNFHTLSNVTSNTSEIKKKNINSCCPTKVNVTKGKLGLQRKMPLRFQIKV